MIKLRPTKPREIPEVLQQLALKSARLFVGEMAANVMNFMIKQDCIGEVELGARLYFDSSLLKGQLSDLLREHFIEKRSKILEIDGKLTETIYYFVNYKSLARIIQYKLFKMRQILVQESEMKDKNGSKNPDVFECTNRKCGRRFSEFDARALVPKGKNEYFCLVCHELVAEIKVDALGSSDKLVEFQQFTEPLLKLVEEASKFNIDIEPEPEVIKEVKVSIEPTNNTEEASCSKDSQVIVAPRKSLRLKKTKVDSKVEETNISTGTDPAKPEEIDVNVVIDDDNNIKESDDADFEDEFMSDSDTCSD